MKPKPTKKATTVFLNPQQQRALQRLAARLDRSMGSLMREGIDRVIEQYKQHKEPSR